MTSASIQYYTGRPPDEPNLDTSSCLSHEARLKRGQRPSYNVQATPKIATVKPIRTVKPMRKEQEQSSQKKPCKHKCADPILCKNCIQDLYTIKSPSQFNDHNKEDDYEEKVESEREKSANCWNKKYKTTLLPSIAEDSNCDSENDDTVFSSNSSSNGLHSISSEGSEYGGGSLLDSLHKRFYPSQYSPEYKTRLVEDSLSSKLSHSKSDGFVQVTSPKQVRRLPQSKCVSWTADDDRLVKQTNARNEAAEIEAAEACKWLRAAGFPQYSQLYEAAEFPIDLSTVEKDHEFLDSVELQSLFRRLETLNKCAAMKLDPTIKKSSSDSDEEDYALSNKWTFERPSRRWSRIETSSSGVEVLRSCSSRDSVSAEQSSTQNSPTTPSKTELVVPEVVRESQSTVGSLLSPRLRRAATEKLKGAKNILKRVESLRHSKNKKKKKEKSGSSSPTPEASPSSPIHQLVNTPKRSSRPFASDSSSYTTAFSHLSIDSQESVLHLDSSSEVVRRPDRGQQETSDEHKRSSLYDNLETVSNDAQNQFDMILQDLQRDINALDESLNGKKGAAMPMPKITCDTEKVEQEIDRLSEKTSASSYTPSGGQDSSENDTQHSPTTEKRERRDSGVGLSLTRVPSARRRQAAIWHSFLGYTIQEKITGDGVDMSSLCVGQLLVLKKMAMLKLSSRIDTHAPPGTRLNWDSFVPKFMRRCKSTTSAAQKHVFGVPLHMIEQRTGDPLPQPISKAMSFILEHCSNSYAVGLFRKNGQQTRIQQMKNEIECGGGFRDHYEISSLLDTCDLVKSFFRELPECLFTNRYSPMILSIFKHLPKDNWLELTQASILLLPDENRRVLRALASFLLQISRHHLSNGMTEHNLAVCIAPNLFPPLTSSTVHGKTMADSKEVQDQKAAIDCVRFIIENAEELFTISKATYEESSAKVEQYNPSPYEVVRDCGHLKNAIDVLFKEHLDKWKNYDSAVPTMRAPGVDISLKKVSDGYPLRLWKSSAEITAPPNEVLERILHERHIWDERILETEVLETTDNDSDVICYILDGSKTMPRSVVCTMRHWTKDIGKGMCALVSTSVHHRKAKNFDDAECRVVFAERFLIEPCGSGKSLVTSLYRVDIRGHSSDWYKRQGGVEMAHLLSNLRDSFRSRIEGPETKV